MASGDPPVDAIEEVVFSVDEDWRITAANARASSLLNVPVDLARGRTLWDVLPDEIDDTFTETLFSAMESGSPKRAAFAGPWSDEWLEIRAYPFYGGLAVLVLDMTERVERENDLEQFAGTVEAMDDGVIVVDDAYRIVSINDVVAEAIAVDPEDVVGEHIESITEQASVPNEDVVTLGRAIDEVRSGAAHRRTVHLSFTAPNGTDRRCELRIGSVETDPEMYALVFRDVTAQRDYETLVHSLHEVTRWLLESSDPEEICAIAVQAGSDLLELPISGIWLLDSEQGYLDPIAGNAGAYDHIGGLPQFSPGDGLVWDVFDDGEPALFDDVTAHEDVYNEETVIRSEMIVPIGTHGVMMSGSLEPGTFDETDLELVATLAENTRAALDRAERERVLRERTERLERQSERLEAVATVLSEELKSELVEIAAMLDEEPTGSARWEFPIAEAGVKATLDRIERLVDDIRMYARNATSVGQRARVDLETAIQDAIDRSGLEDATLVVEDGATLRADPDRFRYMLETVFNDAAARSAGAVTIQVDTVGLESNTEGSRGFFILHDASRNPPTASETLPSLRITADESKDGLGLAVARAIAEAHDWSVSIGVGERGGMRFEVRDVTTLEPE